LEAEVLGCNTISQTTLTGRAYDSLTSRWIGAGIAACPRLETENPARGERGRRLGMEARCWSTGPGDIRRGGLHAPDGRARAGAARGLTLAPHRSQFGHPIAQLEPQPQARLPAVRSLPWGNVARRRRGGIMDNVERSFAAATAAGFVVLVIGLALLALL